MPGSLSRFGKRTNHRKQEQHWRHYRSGKFVLVNHGILYKKISELDRQLRFSRAKANVLNAKILAYQRLLNKTVREMDKDLIKAHIEILKDKQVEINNYIIELQREKLLASIDR